MSLTRNSLKGMGLADEQVSAIIEMHTESTEALKAQRDEFKADAEKLAEVQNILSLDIKIITDTFDNLMKHHRLHITKKSLWFHKP